MTHRVLCESTGFRSKIFSRGVRMDKSGIEQCVLAAAVLRTG